MPKAKAHPNQLPFDFAPPAPAKGVAELAGLERQVCELVGTVLASDPRSREEIAGAMSAVLNDTVSKAMLDAYASGARPDHKVPASRLFALLVVTDRQDLLDPIMRKIGAALLVGEEVKTARLGQIETLINQLREEQRRLRNEATPIRDR
ncbi:hypothetical protein [Erythrobacter tepidarius]|uniref:hypothetical protein n=1 Tax=Erythrobacter tepidarius TaxID=60454 RepID=UPI00117DFA9C|nr:hypothetical protein [Erythrobacter tepidarius]